MKKLKMIRNYLLTNEKIKSFASQDGKGEAIFLEGKGKIEVDNYIILKQSPLDLGVVEVEQIDVLVFSKDLEENIIIEKEIETLLNDVRGDKIYIEDDIFIRDTTALTGGGRQYDSAKERWVSIRYYRITT